MTEFVEIKNKQILPEEKEILSNQGITENSKISSKIHFMVEDAIDIFIKYSTPSSIYKEISIGKFDEIFEGEGNKEEEAPLKKIYPEAKNLALFAATLGNKISNEIERLFKNNDFAPGFMLDSVASLAADKSVELLENHFYQILSERKQTKYDSLVLSYSPGYCGWVLSTQKKLFKYLHPEKIGIELNDSFLMTPLKSVTGVLVHGEKEIHRFDNNFEFCNYCKNQTCYERMEKIFNN